MIYLIDDDKGNKRVTEFGVHFVDDNSFSDCLTAIDRLPINADLSFLSEAVCLLVHKTTEDISEAGEFIAESTLAATTIINTISDYGQKIPLVIFSNRMSEKAEYNYDENPACIYSLKKNIFYTRLYDFLMHYRSTMQLELRIIAYGKNYRAVEIGRYASLIADNLARYSPDNFFKTEQLKELSMLEKFYQLSGLAKPYDLFLIELEDNPITLDLFLNNITLIVESIDKYGQNIHDWEN